MLPSVDPVDAGNVVDIADLGKAFGLGRQGF